MGGIKNFLFVFVQFCSFFFFASWVCFIHNYCFGIQIIILFLCLLLRLLKGRSIPGKVLLTRRPDQIDDSGLQDRSPSYQRSFSQNDAGTSDDMDKSIEVMLRVKIYCFQLLFYYYYYIIKNDYSSSTVAFRVI